MLLSVLCCSGLFSGCDNDREAFLSDDPETAALEGDESLYRNLTVENGKWVLPITKLEVRNMNKFEEYTRLRKEIDLINDRNEGMLRNPRAFTYFALPEKHIVMNNNRMVSCTEGVLEMLERGHLPRR